MAQKPKESIFEGLDLHLKINNFGHRTNEISLHQLIVRRGQPFKLTLNLRQPFDQKDGLLISAATGKHPTQEQGTLSLFSIPGLKKPSPSAKAVWKVELHKDASPRKGLLVLTIIPPADTPIGEFRLTVKHRDEEKTLPTLVVLYNPWCSDDWVYLKDEKEVNEYVMNEKGILYQGSTNRIFSLYWDFGQFEDKMVDICLKILDLNPKHLIDPGDDVSARCNPIYVGRVISAMINCQDDCGVLAGRWSGPYDDGFRPSHWTGSHAILKRWLESGFRSVKYGQCWVFAGVMCSVMRLLGIPCRAVTNFQSAHDNNKNIIIDFYQADDGVREKPSSDSVWNFHVWVEAWMRRPDLAEDGKYDGWQVLDPTPQEKSDGVFCCGPAPVTAIRTGQVDLKYDLPFVFAEVNADCNYWRVKADGSKKLIRKDISDIGQDISTKAVGSNWRSDITNNYKPKEGTIEERLVVSHATTRDGSKVDEEMAEDKEDDENEEMEEYCNNEESITLEEMEEGIENEEDESADEAENETAMMGMMATARMMASESLVCLPRPTLLPEVSMQFKEVTPPTNGKVVRLQLVLKSESTAARLLSINIKVQAMRYNGKLCGNIQNEVKEKTLQPGKDLVIPVRIPFSDYRKHMVECDSIRFLAVVTDKEKPDYSYLAKGDVVLLDPPITIDLPKTAKKGRMVRGAVIFKNPVYETLMKCTLTLSGSGLLHDEYKMEVPDLKKNQKIRMTFTLIPNKIGKRTLLANFDCSTFRDIKGSCTINIKPAIYLGA